MGETWVGDFDEKAYEAAFRVLETDRQRATNEVKAVLSMRGRLVAIVAIVWAVCSVALVFANPELLLAAEIGWIVVVVFAVFFLLPSIMGRGNMDELFDQYEMQLKELHEARVPMPAPSCMEDLVAALDLVSVPDGAGDGQSR